MQARIKELEAELIINKQKIGLMKKTNSLVKQYYSNKTLKLTVVLACFLAFLSSCNKDEIRIYKPVDKMHIGKTYAYNYTIDNIKQGESGVVLNFYKEEVTDLDYIEYDETNCYFVFRKGDTSKYKISWDFTAHNCYVEIQYSQNGMWHKINQYDWNEYILTANDGMLIRMTCQPGKKQINMKVSEFSIKEYTGEQNSNQMGNFEENRKAKEERKERDKASRENLGKFFYDLAKLSFATLVIGSTASVIIQENNLESWIIISVGAFVTYIFAYIGYKIIK